MLSAKKVGAVIIGGDFQGLGVLRSLAKQDIPIYLLDTELCIAKFSRYRKKFIKCPDPQNEMSFLNFLKELAERQNLRGWIVFPTNDQTVRILSENRDKLKEYYRIPTPSWDVVKFAYDKKLTYQLAEKYGIDIPKTFCPGNLEELQQLNLELPVIIKPSVKTHFFNKTRKKALRADNRKELVERYKEALSIIDSSEIMIQELIPGGPDNLFSFCSLFKNGEVLGKLIARRSRQHPMDFGRSTTYAETIDVPELEEVGKKILKLISYYGLSEVEFMQDPRDGKYKLLEINARIWAWHTLGTRAGVDFPYLLYRDMLGESVKISSFKENIKWIRLITDVPTVATQILKGKMKIINYFNSLKGQKEFAVFSIIDPFPFIVEILKHFYIGRGAYFGRSLQVQNKKADITTNRLGVIQGKDEKRDIRCLMLPKL